MTLAPGSRLGPYEVLAAIGAGGMGEVYRARDSRLKRDVAIKVLPELFAQNPERLARFQREAELLAALNHPNIAAIYGLEDGALVLELVEGPTLADRIARGALPLDEALPIARQIADALDAAHGQGVIHRDLKPANIKVRPDGTVKVLDFGLAKALEPAPGAIRKDVSQSPTITTPAMTRAGMVLGTAAYMSPEQARGRDADKRSDVWAFGCVLYEMLTGRRTFDAEETSDTLAAVLRAEPDWHALPPELPEAIPRLLRRCIEKDRQRRLRDIGDARIEIDEAQSGAPGQVARPLTVSSRRRVRVLGAALALVSIIAVAFGVLAFRPSRDAPELRLDIANASATGTDSTSLAIAPDGQRVVFAATSDGVSRLWLRGLGSVSAQPIGGTDGAALPFWSPDSRSIAFFADGWLKRLDLDSGSSRQLIPVPVARGGAWLGNGTILFASTNDSPIMGVPEGGGPPVAVTRFVPGQFSQSAPQPLPDGRHFTYYAYGRPGIQGVFVGGVEGEPASRLFDADSTAVYCSGHLLFVRQGTVMAQRFDLARLSVTGTPFSLAVQGNVSWNGLGSVALSASLRGLIVYRTGLGDLRQLTWFDRSGKSLGRVGQPISSILNPSMSPDGRRLAFQRTDAGNNDIWVLELGRENITRFTSDPSLEVNPIWSPDNRIAFGSNRAGGVDLYQKDAAGTGGDEPLVTSPHIKSAMDWSPDGRVLLYRDADPVGGFDIWALPLDSRKPFPVVHTRFQERDAQFSPDGKWMAFQSDETGRFEVYVQAFPGRGPKWPISTDGGAQVRWRKDGHELFYIGLDRRLMAVPIRLSSIAGALPDIGRAVALFHTQIGEPVPALDRQQYMVSDDGQRFLMNILSESPFSPITVILNWKARP